MTNQNKSKMSLTDTKIKGLIFFAVIWSVLMALFFGFSNTNVSFQSVINDFIINLVIISIVLFIWVAISKAIAKKK